MRTSSFSPICPFPSVPLPLKSRPTTAKTTAAPAPTAATSSIRGGGRGRVKAFFFNPSDQRVLKEALSEPVAFMGGMFAGLLRLDLSEDPLKEWVTRTVEASGMIEEEIDDADSKPEENPQQIEIE